MLFFFSFLKKRLNGAFFFSFLRKRLNALPINALFTKELIYHVFFPTPVISHLKKVSDVGIIWLCHRWRDGATGGWEEFIYLHPLASKRD